MLRSIEVSCRKRFMVLVRIRDGSIADTFFGVEIGGLLLDVDQQQ
jgi:hypothetical protein